MTQSKGQQDTKTIHDAVRANNVKDLEFLVGRGVGVNDIDRQNNDKFTPLHWAAHAGSLECMHWLLWKSADKEAQTPKGWTPVHIAAIRGHDACIQALINNNVNINARDRRGQTGLHLASAHGNSFVVHTLLRGGADIHHQDINGWTPAFTATYHGRLGCLQMLVKWGAKLDDVDNEGNTAAHLATMEGHLPCLKFIISAHRDITAILGARNDQGDTPKALAEQFHKDNCCTYLDALEWEQDHPEQVENLAFPAHVAAYNGDLEHVKLLVEQGVVSVNERDERGATLAHKAAGQGHIDILRWLIDMGATMDLVTQSGETPKDVARRFSQLACLKILTGGADKLENNISHPQNGSTRQRLTPKEEERGRAKQKYEELQKQFEIAKKNYCQLGGQLEEVKNQDTAEQDSQRKTEELEKQLEFERVKREKRESELDECRREIARLINALRALEESRTHTRHRPASDSRQHKNKKPSSASGKRSRHVEKETGLVFIRKNSVNS